MERLAIVREITEGVRPALSSSHALQRPVLYYPGLTSKPCWSVEDFPWARRLLASHQSLKAELVQALAEQIRFDSVFRGYEANERWAALWFNCYGQVYSDNCARFPATLAAIAEIPRLAGWAAYSVLPGDAHVKAHCGLTNAKLRLQFSVLAEQDSIIRIGAARTTLRPGQILVFDDSFEHEVWTEPGPPRFVLIVDFYHPDLSTTEVTYLQALETAPSRLFGATGLRGWYLGSVARAKTQGDASWIYVS